APINYVRARDVLCRLNAYTAYTPEGAARVLRVLSERYPLVFSRLEQKSFTNGAVLLEMPGASLTGPLVFVCHLDAPATEDSAPGDAPQCAALERAHAVTLLEALEGLLGDGYQPGGDLLLAFSMDGLSGGAGAQSIAAHLKARGLTPCFVLDYGGYATMEAFRTYLPRESPLALIGVTEKGVVSGTLTGPTAKVLRAGARLSRCGKRASLCPASAQMLVSLGRRAPLLQRWFVRSPYVSFPLMRLLWRKRAVREQFFVSRRTVYSLAAQGTPQSPAATAELRLCQTLIPGRGTEAAARRIRLLAGRGVKVDLPVRLEPSAPSQAGGQAWDALVTSIEIQFERAVAVPCLSPLTTDGRFYAELGGRVYRFSPFLLTGEEALHGLCTITDGTLQTAVQFFRSMLSV
ncbi:MAG: hypothetical protein MRZ54_02175, partial [Clostridiales bacterium]|nr:hypothetical protein [Clostridiales bacterium]